MKRSKRKVIVDEYQIDEVGYPSPRSYLRDDCPSNDKKQEEEEEEGGDEEVQYPTAWQTDRFCNVSIIGRPNKKSKTGRFVVKVQGKVGKQQEKSFKWKTNEDMERAETEANGYRKRVSDDLGLRKENEWRLIDEDTIEMKIRIANATKEEDDDYFVFFDSILGSHVIKCLTDAGKTVSRKWVLRKKMNGQRRGRRDEKARRIPSSINEVDENGELDGYQMTICAHGQNNDPMTGERHPYYDEMPSWIMSPGDGDEVVHLDGNIFNNRRSNLRLKRKKGIVRDEEGGGNGERLQVQYDSNSESQDSPSHSDRDRTIIPEDENNDLSSGGSDSIQALELERRTPVSDDDDDDDGDDDGDIVIRCKRKTPDDPLKEKTAVRSPSGSSRRIVPFPPQIPSKKKRQRTKWKTTDPNRWRISNKDPSVVQIELRKRDKGESGKYALVDFNRMQVVKNYKWRYWINNKRKENVRKERVSTTVSDGECCEGHTNGKYKKTVDMHRLLRPQWKKIGHNNGKILDNRSSNLYQI